VVSFVMLLNFHLRVFKSQTSFSDILFSLYTYISDTYYGVVKMMNVKKCLCYYIRQGSTFIPMFRTSLLVPYIGLLNWVQVTATWTIRTYYPARFSNTK
jgi:hypothetical protein